MRFYGQQRKLDGFVDCYTRIVVVGYVQPSRLSRAHPPCCPRGGSVADRVWAAHSRPLGVPVLWYLSWCVRSSHRSPGVFTLLSSFPLQGPADGGTTVNVTGSQLVSTPTLNCRFGGLAVPATFISSTMVKCTTPPAVNFQASSVAIEVSLNGQDFKTSSSRFEYLSIMVLRDAGD